MNKSKIFKVLLMSIILIIGVSQLVYAAGLPDPPWSECYWFNDPGVGTTYDINHFLHYVGYDARVYGNLYAYLVRRTMYKDAVFYVSAHGVKTGGRVRCGYLNGHKTYISAKSIPWDDYNYSLEAAFANTTDKLKWCRLVYWSACRSARNSSTYGDLNDYSAITLGADSSVGFRDDLGIAHSATFDKRCFDCLIYNGGNKIKNSCETAKNYTYKVHGSYGGVDSYEIRGYTTGKILPVGYGDY